jgi:hypothetical protein
MVTITDQDGINWEDVKREFELTSKELPLLRAIFLNELKNEASTMLSQRGE